MIWIILLAFICLDAYVDHLFRVKADQRRRAVNYWPAVFYRLAYGADLAWHFELQDRELAFFFLGGFFFGWLLFPIIRNLLNRRPWDWLGRTLWIDRFERLLPEALLMTKAILAAVFIYAFYNAH